MDRDELLKKVDELITEHCGDRVQIMDQISLAEGVVEFMEQHAGAVAPPPPENPAVFRATGPPQRAEPSPVPPEVIKIAHVCCACGMKLGHRHGDLTEEICAFIKRTKS